MSTLLLAPMTVSMDEPCYLLEERIEAGKGGYRRVQVLTVVRNTGGVPRLTRCQVDMGIQVNPVHPPPFNVLGGVREYRPEACLVCKGQGKFPDPEGVPWFPKVCAACNGQGVVEGGRIYIEETVGTLRDIADTKRAGYLSQPDMVPTDLKKAWRDKADQRRRDRRGLKTFGALHPERN